MAKRKKPPITLAGCDGRFEVGAAKIVDPTIRQLVPVAVNVRESALAHMASRGRLDAAQFAAGERLRKLYEQAAIGGARSVNLEGASGGGGDIVTDAAINAFHELRRALIAAGGRQELAGTGAKLLAAVVGDGRRIEDVAAGWSRAGGIVSGKRAEGFVTGRLIEAIDDLVAHWGMIGRRRVREQPGTYRRAGQEVTVNDSITASGPLEFTGPAYEIHIGRFGDALRETKRPLDNGPLTVHATGNLASPASNKRRKRT